MTLQQTHKGIPMPTHTSFAFNLNKGSDSNVIRMKITLMI